MKVIETHGLKKAYGSKMAVDHFDMQIKRGDIYGFVGRNGAGKSTVMKMIAGLAHPTGGEIRLFGQAQGEGNAHERIGVLIENPGFYPRMSAYENMMVKALCLGLADPKSKITELLTYVGLAQVAKKPVGQFSMGMKQRLGLALALLGDPDILLLDEPHNGMDPEGTQEMRHLLQGLNEQRGVTILISSHVIDQLGKIATRYGVIRDGIMVRELTAAEVEQECQDYVQVVVDDPSRALAILTENFPQAQFTAMPDGSLRLLGDVEVTDIGAVLSKEQIVVYGLHTHKRELEEFFVELMGADYHV